MRYHTIACLALVAGLAGCGVAGVRGMPPESPATTTTVELGTAATLTPAYCRAWAPHIEEDDSPWVSPNGAKLVDFDSMDDIGCATYADGWAYDGLGWIAPTEG